MDADRDLVGLLSGVAREDRASFRERYDVAGSKLVGICLRICRDRSLAEEALQETYLEIWRRATSYDPGRGAPGAWMSIIARHRSLDVLRRQARRPALASAESGEALEAADKAVPRDGGVDGMALRACLERLESEQREAVILAYREGYSREELAERYAAPVNTIKSRLRRALELLKGCLEE